MNESGSVEPASVSGVLPKEALEQLARALPGYVAASRWYRSKSKDIRSVRIEDAVQAPDSGAYLLVIQLQHASGAGDRYILPLIIGEEDANENEEVIARVSLPSGEGKVRDALRTAEFRTELLAGVACEKVFSGQRGTVNASRTSALRERCNEADLTKVESFVSRAEQSNTSIIYKDKYILKLFRKLESGVNPDLEVGRFLTERGFKYTPAVLGSLEYRIDGKTNGGQVGILQEFVSNRGDAWKYTLDSLEEFFSRALSSGQQTPEISEGHLLETMERTAPSVLQSLAGPYLESAALLGRRTAQMHAALTDEAAGPDFVPEPLTDADAQRLYGDCITQANIAFELLRQKASTLPGPSASVARQVIAKEQEIAERFEAVREASFDTVRIRHHGDYHLGQVLYTGTDFAIIDFEGEPARALDDRRVKALALRDVAGMVRSFQYAAYAALFRQVTGVPIDPASRKAVEAWAEAWNGAVTGAYLKGYFDEAQGAAFVPKDKKQQRILLDVFLLQKALYEVAYEINNRPDWLLIPLRGILSLLS